MLPSDDEHIAIVGARVGSGDVHIGDVFTKCKDLLFQNINYETGESIQGWTEVRDVNLEVVKMKAYGKLFLTLNPGMTAEFHLRGAGVQHISDRTRLYNEE